MPAPDPTAPSGPAAYVPDPVAIVGAGVCGLAAAARLRARNIPTLLIEAGPVPGGRARTVHPDCLAGLPFDDGAAWFHQVDRNPLVVLARAAGTALDPAHDERRRLLLDDRPATAAEEREYHRADGDWRRFATARATDPDAPDSSLADAGTAWSPRHPWLPNLEFWEGTIIAAADPDRLSLRDWHRNGLDGDDLLPRPGLGTTVRRLLEPPAGPISLDTTVRGIDATAATHLVLDTTAGPVRASACIVTVSTGVLRAGRIRFAPALPDRVLAALDGLPMGLLAKAALLLPDPARFDDGIPELIEQHLPHRGAPGMLLAVNAAGAPLATAYLGGTHAWSLEPRPAELLRELRDRLAAVYGAAAVATLPGRGHVTAWATDPRFDGAYSYARPGHADARAALAAPLDDGRLVLAGEACVTDGLAGTVGGAFNDGHRAADAVSAHLARRAASPSTPRTPQR